MFNHKKKFIPKIISSIAALSLIALMGSSDLKAQDGFSSAQSQYDMAVSAHKKGDNDASHTAYLKAVELNSNYIEAWVGLVNLDIELKKYSEASKHLRQARKGKKSRSDKVQLATMEISLHTTQMGKNWFSNTRRAYSRNSGNANSLGSSSIAADFYVAAGEAYMAFDRPDGAKKRFELAIKADISSASAQQNLLKLGAIEMASKGGKIVRNIAKSDYINRNDLIILLTQLFDLPSALKGKVSTMENVNEKRSDGGSDYADSNLKGQILTVHRLGLRFPSISDGAFEGMQVVSRIEMAYLLEDIKAIQDNDKSLKRKYFGQVSPFNDLSASHPGFNAMMNAITFNLMPGSTDGKANPMANVSGATAINALRSIGLK